MLMTLSWRNKSQEATENNRYIVIVEDGKNVPLLKKQKHESNDNITEIDHM